MRRSISLLIAIGAIAIAGQAVAADTPENLVKYRQAVMKAIGGHTGSIAAVVKGEVAFGSHVAAHARGIKDMSLLVDDIFPPNSTYDDYDKTAALPAIWKEPAKFKQAVDNFKAAAAKLAQVAESGDQGAIAAGFGELGKSCGGCHKPFRHKK